MSEQTVPYIADTSRTTAAILELTEREFWANKNRELVRMSDLLCKAHGLSRSGMVKGKRVTVAKLRQIVDKTA